MSNPKPKKPRDTGLCDVEIWDGVALAFVQYTGLEARDARGVADWLLRFAEWKETRKKIEDTT